MSGQHLTALDGALLRDECLSCGSAEFVRTEGRPGWACPRCHPAPGAVAERGGRWVWADGAPAPEVRDLLLGERFDLRRRPDTVEVPLSLAYEEEALDWAIDAWTDAEVEVGIDSDCLVRMLGYEPVRRPELPSTAVFWGTILGLDKFPASHLPLAVLVPVARWELEARKPVGATWDPTDEPHILARAAALGWQPNPLCAL